MVRNIGRILALCCGIWSIAAATPAHAKAPAKPTVTIADGVVIGTATGITNQPSNTGLVNAYLGIPFAQSPPLRFGPPTPPKEWKKPLVAQTLPPACLQQFMPGASGEKTKAFFNNPGLPPPPESEDCLYLNVYAPRNASPKNPKPVLFWIFGGDLQFGTASLAYYNGSSLAINHDVVTVIINYRTNIFGFSNSPEIPVGQQNSGFLDQRLALQWVQQNIGAFGGDPTKVTIFGESAGGYSVKQLLANPPSPLPFHAAIMESQASLFVGNADVNYINVVNHFNCTLAVSPLQCLREVSGNAIKAYITDQSLNFAPVSGDGTNMDNVLPSILSGEFADVPVLMGTNELEGSVFVEVSGLGGDPSTPDPASIVTALGFDLSQFASQNGSLAAPYSSQISGDEFVLLSRIITDLEFTCTTQSLSAAIQQAGRQPVWRYRYDGVFPDVTLFPGAGAYHSCEIPSVFGTYPFESILGDVTPAQIALSTYMQGVWAGFAKNPTQGPNWPKLGSNGGTELSLLGNSRNVSGNTVVPLLEADYPCALYDPILVLSNKAY